MRAFTIFLTAGAVALAAGCQTVETTKGGTVGVDRQQRMAVSSEEVNAGAQKAYAQMMAEAQKKNALDPHAAVSLWEKMVKLGGSQPPQWLSTHPSNESRIADLKTYSERVMPLYQTAKGSNAATGR
jgi:predicted Zn-dependent protease